MPENHAKKEKEVFYLRQDVTVNDRASELVVKIDMNVKKATFKISAFITTEQVDHENPTVIMHRMKPLLEEAIEKAHEHRLNIIQAMNRHPGQPELFINGEQAEEA